MPFTSQKFIDTRSGEIVTQVPISEIGHFEEYNGPLRVGDFDCVAHDWDRGVSAADFGPEGQL